MIRFLLIPAALMLVSIAFTGCESTDEGGGHSDPSSVYPAGYYPGDAAVNPPRPDQPIVKPEHPIALPPAPVVRPMPPMVPMTRPAMRR